MKVCFPFMARIMAVCPYGFIANKRKAILIEGMAEMEAKGRRGD